MKWFKHQSNAQNDDKLVAIRTKFGMWGIGVYWTLIERAAEQMKGPEPSPTVTMGVHETSVFCCCRPEKLKRFLVLLQEQCDIKYTLKRTLFTITVPKLLEIKDNQTTNLQASCKRFASKEAEKEKQREQEAEGEREEEQKENSDSGHAPKPRDVLEAIEYALEIELTKTDAEKFFDYYTANGWKTGRNPMKDWRAALRNWKRNNATYGNHLNRNQQPLFPSAAPGSQQARATYHGTDADVEEIRQAFRN